MSLNYTAKALRLLKKRGITGKGPSSYTRDTPGAVKPSDIDELIGKIYEELTSLNTAAGIDTLAELLDTNISSPTDGQILSYSSGDSTWVNTTSSSIQTASVSLNASEIQNGNTTPKEIVAAPGEGKALVAQWYIIQYTGGSTIFDVGTKLEIKTDGASGVQLTLPGVLNNILNLTTSKDVYSTNSPTDAVATNVIEDASLLVSVDADSTEGDGTAVVIVGYLTIDI